MKMNKKSVKILSVIILIFIFFSNIITVMATDQLNPTNPTINSFQNAMQILIGIFEVLAVGVGVIMLTVLAIKYISSAPGDKAEIKKHAVVYIVGAVMAFGATGIVEIIRQFTIDTLK